VDKWDSAAFSSILLASSFLCSQTESTPAHLPLTQTVGRFVKEESLQENKFAMFEFFKKLSQKGCQDEC